MHPTGKVRRGSDAVVLGIRPDPAAEQALCRYMAALLAGRVRAPVSGSNLHVTIRFIGEGEPDALAAMRHALQGLRLPAPAMSVEAVAAFLQRKPHTVVGLLARDPRLTQLVGAVNAALEPVVPPAEKRPFIGHVTLARSDRRHLARLGEMTNLAVAWWPESISLFESTTNEGAPVYKSLLSIPFDSSAG